MKHLRMRVLSPAAAMALTAFAASSASATTLEVGGVLQTSSTSITVSLTPSTFLIVSRTDGTLFGTCTTLHLKGRTEAPFTVAGSGELSGKPQALTFTNCERPVITTPTDLGVSA